MKSVSASGGVEAEAAERGDGARKSRRSSLRPKIVRNKRLRAQVFERDQGRCAVCDIYDAKWEADHIQALWQGGSDTLDNLQTLCRRHHLEKSVGHVPIRAKTDRLAARHELTRKRRAIRETER